MDKNYPANRTGLFFGKQQNTVLFICLLFLLLVYSCANRGTLEGGPRDIDPPKLDSLHSTPNYQTKFKKQTISLVFNEWVELRDVFTQVVISPPLEFRPKIERRGKAIEVRFDEKEVLRDSATYVVNFGQSIVDLTEGNPANIVFVFSTGDYIDSLSIAGKILDAASGLPVDGALFLLYENLEDSVVYTERPFYFARTGKDGVFRVNNVKGGTFKAAAMLDLNQNYKYEPESEKIGFLDTSILIAAPPPAAPIDSIQSDSLAIDSILVDEGIIPDSIRAKADSLKLLASIVYKLRLFEKEKTLFLRQKETGIYGLVKLGFNRPPHDAKIQHDSTVQIVFSEIDKDTLKIWYTQEADTSWQIYLHRDTIIDTIDIAAGLKASFPSSVKLEPFTVFGSSGSSKIPPGSSYTRALNHPVSAVNLQMTELFLDSLKLLSGLRASVDTLNPRVINISYPWKEGGIYQLRFLPGSIADVFGLVNEDTISNTFAIGQVKEYGTLTVDLKNLDPEKKYFIRILAANQSAVQTWQVDQQEEFKVTLSYLSPGLYTVEVIEDLDGNGRWTSGEYDLKRQPERVFKKVLEQLRANWELVTEVRVDFDL